VERDADCDRGLAAGRASLVEPSEGRESFVGGREGVSACGPRVTLDREDRENRVANELEDLPSVRGDRASVRAVKSRMSENQIAASMSSPFPRWNAPAETRRAAFFPRYTSRSARVA
jgi:hypothetical protein